MFTCDVGRACVYVRVVCVYVRERGRTFVRAAETIPSTTPPTHLPPSANLGALCRTKLGRP